MVGLVIFAYSFLSKTSEEVGKMQTEAIAVDAKIQSLLASKSQLDRNSDTVKKSKEYRLRIETLSISESDY